MTQYSTDFSGYTAGAAPSDWSNFTGAVWSTWQIQTVSDSISGKAFVCTSDATETRRANSWNTVPTAADAEVLWHGRVSAVGALYIQNTYLRHNGLSSVSGSDAAYMYVQNGSSTQKTLASLLPFTSLGTQSFTPAADTYYWIRMRASGTTIQAKIWSGAYSSEPGTWGITVTNATISAAGSAAFGLYTPNITTICDYFAVGTSGDAAPGPDTAPPAAPTGLTFVGEVTE